ncbi:MAG: 2Fe-2S ferredoxin, partial [Streptomyces sp.]|nr:2Fe-2S ferredoxin [Streptomyces sp.]
MSDRAERAGWTPPLRRRRRSDWATQAPTWREARPALIADALKRASGRPCGNWFVVGASRDVRAGDRPYGRTVGGVEVVLWRSDTG